MSLGSDIAELLSEVASSFVILRDSGDISGEYCDISINFQATKPFIISYFRNAVFQYNSNVISGDVIIFDNTEDSYLITTLNPEEFENSIVTKQGVLYLCNVSGELLRPSGEVWNTDYYHKEQSWETIKSDCRALLVNPELRNKLTDEEAVMVSIEDNELYLPASVGVAVNDRYVPVSGEYYKIDVVNSYRYFGISVCKLVEDTR